MSSMDATNATNVTVASAEDSLRLYPSRLVGSLLALVLLAITAFITVKLLATPGVGLSLALILFALLTGAALYGLLSPGRSAIVLSPAGYSTAPYLRRGVVVPWDQIEKFYLGSLPTARVRSKAILYRLAPAYLDAHPTEKGILRVIGSDPMVPSYCGYSANRRPLGKKETVRLLEEWRKRYSRPATTSSPPAQKV